MSELTHLEVLAIRNAVAFAIVDLLGFIILYATVALPWFAELAYPATLGLFVAYLVFLALLMVFS